MSDEPSHERRRPHREEHSNTGKQRRQRENDDSPIEEPHKKVFKVSPDNRTGSSGSSSRDATDEREPGRESSLSDRPSTSSVGAGGDDSRRGRGPGDGAGAGDQRRQGRERYELVVSRPPGQSKCGSLGQAVTLQANYFRLLTTPKWKIYQYHIDFSPTVEMRRLRSGLLSEHCKVLGGFLFDGNNLFNTIRLPDDKTVFISKSRLGEEFTITVKYTKSILMTEWESLQVLNLIFRRAMSGLNLQMIGRNFFDALAKIDLREFRLQLWPGYQTAIRQHERDIMLCAEITHKVMRTETVYDILMKCTETAKDFQEDFRRQIIGLTVLTDYNNKTYCITDVDFSKNPKHTFPCKDKEVKFVDYYYQKYNIRIRDPNQPLLLSKSKDRQFREKGDELLILIPELCRVTGLSDNMRNNFQLMRCMADHTRLSPDRRIDRLRMFNQRLQKTSASMQVLKDWNMTLDTNLAEVKGRILEPQKIVYVDHKKVSAGEQADWTRSFRDNGMFTSPSRGLERWAVIGMNRNSRDLRNFVDALIRAAGGMKMHIARPQEVMIYDDRNNSFLEAIGNCSHNDPQIILIVVPNNNLERYALIKKKSCLDRGIPTQVVTQKTAGNQRGVMSIATKVAIQINCKLGYTPWMIDLPLSGLMTIGYDVAKSSRDRSKAYGALVATMDMKTNATFYSTVAECSSYDVLANSLWPMMTKALRQYQREHNGKLPVRIIFYRDGVSEGSLKQVVEHEVKDIVSKLEQEYKRAETEKPPMFAYVIVTKRINTRFFARGRNPLPGTVVDDVVTLPEHYDFFLVSQSVRQGTVSPTYYNVVHSSIRLTPDQMQLLTYKMTHLYYNWSGTTRVPAVCQYAKKLATLVSTALYQPPLNALEKKLYYL